HALSLHDALPISSLSARTFRTLRDMSDQKPLRQRIREAGGFYRWFNSRLIRYAGPAQVGPYGEQAPPPCDRCGRPKGEHIAGEDGALRCPEPRASDA